MRQQIGSNVMMPWTLSLTYTRPPIVRLTESNDNDRK
jgi:hypothetical protein